MFNGGRNDQQREKDKAFSMMGMEVEYRVDLYNKLVGSCHTKCIDAKYKDGELNTGENSCIDRCAAKYWQVVSIVGSILGQGGAQQ